MTTKQHKLETLEAEMTTLRAQAVAQQIDYETQNKKLKKLEVEAVA